MLKFYSLTALLLFTLMLSAQEVSTFLTQPGSQFEGITWGHNGRIYVVDFATGDLFKMTIDGPLQKLGTYNGALGGTMDAAGNFYFSEYNTGKIIKYDVEDNSEVYCEGLIGPAGILIDEENQIMYVANYFGSSIAKIDMSVEEPSPMILASGGLINGPDGLAFSPEGDLISANFNDNSIQRITPTGEVSQFATISASQNSGYIQRKGNQYIVTGAYSPQIYSISLDGEVSHFAGAIEAGYADGPLADAQFFFPNGVSLSPTGDSLILTESGEQGRIRLITGLDLISSVDNPTTHLGNIELTPNPSADYLNIQFEAQTATQLEIQLLDIKGTLVKKLWTGQVSAGVFNQQFTLDSIASSGLYLLHFLTTEQTYSRKVFINRG